MKYGHPVDIAEAVTRPLTLADEEDNICRQCGEHMVLRDGCCASAFCDPCAQAAIVVLAEHVQGKYVDKQLDRLASGTVSQTFAVPPPRRGRRKR